MRRATNWFIVERHEDGAFHVWLDEHDDVEVIGANSIIIGSGLTRAVALRSAHDEMLAHAETLLALALQEGAAK